MQLRCWHFIAAMVAGWLCREQEGVIDYLNEENRVLRELMGTKRLPVLCRQRHEGHVDGRYYLGKRPVGVLNPCRPSSYALFALAPFVRRFEHCPT